MKFLLSLYLEPSALPGEGLDHEEFLAAAGPSGELVGGHVLADPSVGAVTRVRGGAVTVTEGPYLTSADQVACQYVVDCESRERAVELAVLLAAGQAGGVEVRPLMNASGMEM
ncbi:YciI family protein [Nonomuraea pusilla]|uniref:Uncharacterized conserved protein n=1 Tax=Nonomuraea pusilla TaxID=46177 RepID=A0A1H7YKW8_9ACTN|nr:YciI family protein [Nonomuraea pusilla]SEM45937.1 Uncharacterized conserved protein [Nonomuraea pusilla]